MKQWQGIESVVVVGLGITGLSVVKHLIGLDKALTVRVIDTREAPPGKDKLPPGIELHAGGWNTKWLLNADLVVVNPGIALATPEIQQVLSKGTPVVGDIELFAWAVDKPVVAITGSNGKSTVTDLTGVLANAAGVKTEVGGNIGVPALDLLATDAELFVLELSSFQLETTSSLHLEAAAFLNLSEDHMDRYQGMHDYRAAKLRIFNHTKSCIVNRDDRETYPKTPFSNKALVEFVSHADENVEFGTVISDGIEWLRQGNEKILPCFELSLVGRHNVANVLVSLAILAQLNINYHRALSALKDYNGLSHRCQVVAKKSGITWVNDSKATNVASTLAALSGLDLKGKLYLLVGGDGKGADFTELSPVLNQLNVKLCCYGRDAQEFLSLSTESELYGTIEDAMLDNLALLKSGDMVMLSPACASFDQFPNFMRRGDVFTELAKKLA
jgi:UDP-N-acetylmuramoylalanine--D-glutamate ligase